MPVETHEVLFSFDQPGNARHPLLLMLQQLLNRPQARSSRATALLGSHRVLIIDSQQERGEYIAHLLAAGGYWPFIVSSSLDAYTLFLQGTSHPFAIILSEDSAVSNPLFLTRLAQQFVQRYDWNVPFIRLRTLPSQGFGLRSTEPLAPGRPPQQRYQTLPLNQPNDSGTLQRPLSNFTQSRLPAVKPDRAPQGPTGASQSPYSTRPLSPSAGLPASAPASSSGPLAPRAPGAQPPFLPASAPASFSGPLVPRAPGAQPPFLAGSQAKLRRPQTEKISLDGLTVGRYQLQSLIGSDPIGDVYLSYDHLREQEIALKTIQINMIPARLLDSVEGEYNLFQPELELFQRTDHPHLVRTLSIGKSQLNGVPFIYKVMPFYREGSLAHWLRQFSGRLFPPSEVARVILQIANAIQFLHNRGLLYQNFKLSNLLVLNSAQKMSELHLALCDLPLVHDMLKLPKNVDAYRYYAPEQWENEAFTSSDQYSLAVLTCELLTGRAPFQGNAETVMRRMHLTMPAPAPSSLNSRLGPMIDKVILRALAKRPAERFESVSAFAAALEQVSK